MSGDPLTCALTEISTDIDSEMQPIMDALLAGEGVDEAWAEMVIEVLDEA